VAHVWTAYGTAVQHFLKYLSFQYPDLELERSALSVVLFQDVLPGAPQSVACAPVGLDGQVDVAVGIPYEVQEHVRLLT